MKKKGLVITLISIVSIPVIITLAIIFYYVAGWGLVAAGTSLQPNPPKPEITYAEFPFTLVYEIDGKTKTIDDVMICKFDGFTGGANGKVHKWKQFYKNNNQNIILLTKKDSDNDYIVVFDPGAPSSYMGRSGEPQTRIFMRYKSGGFTVTDWLDEYELLNMCNIKIISWECAPPIKNTFNR